MHSVAVFLTRRAPETVKVYKRSLIRFASHVGFTIENLHEYLEGVSKEKLTGDLLTFADSLKDLGQNSQAMGMIKKLIDFLTAESRPFEPSHQDLI